MNRRPVAGVVTSVRRPMARPGSPSGSTQHDARAQLPVVCPPPERAQRAWKRLDPDRRCHAFWPTLLANSRRRRARGFAVAERGVH
jgi:hypothetical protein